MQTVYACSGGGVGSQQREVANGADVVFTDTGIYPYQIVVVVIVHAFYVLSYLARV